MNAKAYTQLPFTNLSNKNKLQAPNYIYDVYSWAYVNPSSVTKLNHNWVVKFLLFLQDRRLMSVYLDKIKPGMRIWQVAHVYGDLVRKVALATGKHGRFHLTDVTPIQLECAKKKLLNLDWVEIFWSDAGEFSNHSQNYDLICSFFLLHEVPDICKYKIVNNMLDHLSPEGELLFIDYHKPKWWQPVGYILRIINRYLEPFAKSLWNNQIQGFAKNATRYNWYKTTLFGGVYQIVSVTRKPIVT